MRSSCRMVLLLLLLLWTGTRAQSGDGDAEPRIRCTSDISVKGNQLTCELLGGPNAGEDDEDSDAIQSMRLCYTDYNDDRGARDKCQESSGSSVRTDMTAVSDFTLTVHLRRGPSVTQPLNLQKIVKPRRPSVQNVVFNLDSNQAVVLVRTPYQNDYLREQNQLFQLHICTVGSEMTQNMSASLSMKMDLQNFLRNQKYQVRVRALPINNLQGSWSEWSERFSFVTPAADGTEPERSQVEYVLIVCLVSVVLVTFSAGFLWKHKIFSYMWPRIPHPKHTLVQICKPNGGLLLNFSPEVFSALNVYATDGEPSGGAAAADGTRSDGTRSDGTRSDGPCSTQSSGCRSTTSASTEELELSALLGRSCSDGGESARSSAPSPDDAGRNQLLAFGGSQQDEAYVTMSSFYQIK